MNRVFKYYQSNLRETNKIEFEVNLSYDTRSDSDERTNTKQVKRRITPLKTTRRDVTSSESDEAYFELEILESKENTNPRLIEPFHQDLTIQKKRNTSTTSNSIQERRKVTTISTPTTSIMHQDFTEGESGTTIPEQWKLSRMRRRFKKRNRTDDNRIRGTNEKCHKSNQR